MVVAVLRRLWVCRPVFVLAFPTPQAQEWAPAFVRSRRAAAQGDHGGDSKGDSQAELQDGDHSAPDAPVDLE